MTLEELIAKRANVWEQMKEVDEKGARDDSGVLTAEERQKWDKAEGELGSLTSEIERLQRQAERAREMSAVHPDRDMHNENNERSEEEVDAEYREAFNAYLRGGVSGLTTEQRSAIESGYVAPESRAQSVGTPAGGGYLAPAAFRNDLIRTMKEFGAVQTEAQVIDTQGGTTLSWPTVNDTSNVGALLAENTQMAELDVPLGTGNLDAYMYTSKLTRASYQLIQDSAFDVGGFIRSVQGERLGRILNAHFTTGSGVAQPDGIVTGAANGVTAAGAAAITADEIIDLVHSVDPAYRSSPRAKFMLSDGALKLIRKLKASGSGEYLWQPSTQVGIPSSLFGYPVVVNQDMAVPAAGVKSVLFGDFFAGYVVRLVQGVQVITFNERYADFLQTAWASYLRADGTVQNTAAYKALAQP